MGIAELILTAFSLSMDASSVGMTNGMTDKFMNVRKALVIAFFYGFFQFVMPLAGYYASSALSFLLEGIAPWVSFFLLALIGGNMIFDGVRESGERRKKENRPVGDASAVGEAWKGNCFTEKKEEDAVKREEEKKGKVSLDLKKLTLQALATSIDALAVGVTFLALDTAGTLPLNIYLDSLIIGAVTFLTSFAAVWIGKAIGNRLADKAQIVGGVVLVVIGLKILIEGLL